MQMNSLICPPFLSFISRMSSCIHISSITLAYSIHCFMISHVLACCILHCFQLKILVFLFPCLPYPIKCCAIIVMLAIYEEYAFEQISIDYWGTSLVNQYGLCYPVHTWSAGPLGRI